MSAPHPEDPAPAMTFATIERYWRDPVFAAACDAEQAARQAEVDAIARRTMERFWARSADANTQIGETQS